MFWSFPLLGSALKAGGPTYILISLSVYLAVHFFIIVYPHISFRMITPVLIDLLYSNYTYVPIIIKGRPIIIGLFTTAQIFVSDDNA